MKKTAFISFFMACFLCSWVLRAAHEDKREVNGSARGRVHSVSEEEREGGGAVVDQRDSAGKRGHEGNGSASSVKVILVENKEESVLPNPIKPVAGVSIAELMKDLSSNPERMKGILRLSLNPFPLDLIREFWRFSDIQTLSIDRSNFEEVVIPFTDGLRHFSGLKRLEIYRSDLGDSILFFLGIQLPKLPGMREVVFEANRVFTIGIKSLFLGLSEMTNLDRFSWRHMPHDLLIPWGIERLQKRDGYEIEEAIVQTDDTRTEKHFYIWKTPLRFLIEDALPRFLYLRHLDLGGSIVVKSERSRKEVMDLFSMLPSIIRLESLGLSHGGFDEFSTRALSRALVRLAENQRLHSEEKDAARLHNLDLEGVFVDSQNLKDLEHGLKESRYLENLNLANNQITDRGFAHLFRNVLLQMKKLEVLNLSGNPLTDKSIDALKELALQNTNLKKVILSQTQITPGKLAGLRETDVEFVIA